MTHRTPRVRFLCETCGWELYVHPAYIVLVGGIPTSTFVPFHECEGGAYLTERGLFEAELLTTAPAQNFKVTL